MLAEFFTALALAVATAMDNFAVGAAYGFQGRKVLKRSNLLIATSNAGTTLITMILGVEVTKILPETVASFLGATIFLFLGLNDIWGAFTAPPANDKEAEKQSSSKPVGLAEITPVAVGLCFTNIAGGIGAGAAGLSIWLSTLLAFICSLLLFVMGQELASALKAFLKPEQETILVLILACRNNTVACLIAND